MGPPLQVAKAQGAMLVCTSLTVADAEVPMYTRVIGLRAKTTQVISGKLLSSLLQSCWLQVYLLCTAYWCCVDVQLEFCDYIALLCIIKPKRVCTAVDNRAYFLYADVHRVHKFGHVKCAFGFVRLHDKRTTHLAQSKLCVKSSTVELLIALHHHLSSCSALPECFKSSPVRDSHQPILIVNKFA